MKFSINLAIFSGALFWGGISFADPICPALSNIKAGGFAASFGASGHYLTYQIGNYNTDSTWGFIMGPFQTTSQTEAMVIANQILNNMSKPPIFYKECIYDTDVSELYAIAIKDPIIMPMKLEDHIKLVY